MFTAKLSDVPIAVYVIGLLCPLPSLAVHELTKHHDRKFIRIHNRQVNCVVSACLCLDIIFGIRNAGNWNFRQNLV